MTLPPHGPRVPLGPFTSGSSWIAGEDQPINGPMTATPQDHRAPAESDSPQAMFRQVLSEVLPGLRGAIGRQDWDQVLHIAHRLSGSAEMFGFSQVSSAGGAVQALLAATKATPGVKAGPRTVESAQELVRACERAIGASQPRPSGPAAER